MQIKNLYRKYNLFCLIFLLLFSQNTYSQESKNSYSICLKIIRKNKIFYETQKGPFKSEDQVIANWIYEGFKNDENYFITDDSSKEKNIISSNPEQTWPEKFNTISKEFEIARKDTISKYKIEKNPDIEKIYKQQVKLSKKNHPKEYTLDLNKLSSELIFENQNNELISTINLSTIYEDDLPQENDKFTLSYTLRLNTDVEELIVDLITKNKKNEVSNGKYTIISDKKENKVVSSTVTFDISTSVKTELYLKFLAKIESNESNESMNLLKKAPIIIEQFDSEAEQKQENEEKKQIELQIAKENEEKLKKQREQELILESEKQEKQLQEYERKQQEELTKTLEEVTKQSSVVRIQKEYLQDYEPEGLYDELFAAPPRQVQKNIYIKDPNEADENGRTLLMNAAKAGNDWQIKTLIDSGADVNLTDKDGWTALMYAVRYQENLAAVSLLLNSGADVFIENKFKTTALTIATCYNNNPDILKQILNCYEPSNKDVLKSFTMLFISSQPSEYIQLAKLDVFIQKAIPINTFYDGKTLLMYACKYGNSTEAIRILLKNNASVTLRSSEGKNAFDYASNNTNLQHDEVYWSLNRKR